MSDAPILTPALTGDERDHLALAARLVLVHPDLDPERRPIFEALRDAGLLEALPVTRYGTTAQLLGLSPRGAQVLAGLGYDLPAPDVDSTPPLSAEEIAARDYLELMSWWGLIPERLSHGIDRLIARGLAERNSCGRVRLVPLQP